MTTKRVAIAELEGSALDWAVAKSVCPDSFKDNLGRDGLPHWSEGWLERGRPTTDWSQCGPLIERYKVEICFLDGFGWTANIQYGPEFSFYASPLIAACRAIVAAHNPSGYVEVPEELVEPQ